MVRADYLAQNKINEIVPKEPRDWIYTLENISITGSLTNATLTITRDCLIDSFYFSAQSSNTINALFLLWRDSALTNKHFYVLNLVNAYTNLYRGFLQLNKPIVVKDTDIFIINSNYVCTGLELIVNERY